MKKRYRKVGLHEEVFNALKKRTRSLGLTYSDFLRKVLVEDERRKTKELREFFSYLTSIDEKLDLVLMNLPSISIQEKKHPRLEVPGLGVILEVLKAFGEKYILLPQRKKEFKEFLDSVREREHEISLLVVLDVFQKFVELTIVNPNERKDLESRLEELKKRI